MIFNDTALILAAYNGDIDIVRMILIHPKINVNMTNVFNRKIIYEIWINFFIHSIFEFTNFNEIKFFTFNQTALHLAAKKGHLEIVRLLLSSGQIDINLKDILIQKKFIKLWNEFFLMIFAFFIILWNWTIIFNYTALIRASQEGFLEIVQDLLSQKGIDINLKTIFKNWILFIEF